MNDLKVYADGLAVLQSDMTVHVDVDDTLILWKYPQDVDDNTLVSIGEFKVMPHYRHIELLKQFHARGQPVVVWSMGGYSWACQVVDLLGLKPYVTLVMAKPRWYIDDMTSEKWMGKNIFLDPFNPMKDSRGYHTFETELEDEKTKT